MGHIDIIIIALVVLTAVFSVSRLYRNKGKGCGSCKGCCASCAKKQGSQFH